MRIKCPKCGAVYEAPWQPTLVHIGPLKRLTCLACGQKSWMPTNVKDEVNWPKEEKAVNEHAQPTEEELLERRLEKSKYE